MSIGEICIRETVYIDRGGSIVQAAQLMRDHHVGDLVVVDEQGSQRKPVGILTDRDLVVEVLAKEVALSTVTVGDIMSSDLITASETDGLYETIQRMRARGIRRVPVVDGKGMLVGIVSAEDLLDLMADELTALARIGGREQARERTHRP